VPVSYASALRLLRLLRRVPVPTVRVPRVIGVDDFALRRRRSYATIITNAETGERIEVLPGREAAPLEAWLRGHPGIEAVCRDGSAAHAEAVRRALPDALQTSDRWHLWHNLAEAVRKEVAAHSTCWAKAGPPPAEGRQAATTRERWQQVHAPRERGVGLLECARRLNLVLNTVKRYDRVTEPERLIRAPKYRPTLVDPYRDHLRKRRLENPAVPVTHLLQEIRELGCTGSSNLLVRYLNQGRVEADRPALSPRRLARYLLTRPDRLKNHQRERIEAARAACHEMTALADLIHHFAALLDPADGNAILLSTWITSAQAEDLPHLHAFTRGLEKDRAAVDAALTLPHHNGGTEGVNNRTKLIKRQMYGRASFPPPPPPTTEQTRSFDRPSSTLQMATVIRRGYWRRSADVKQLPTSTQGGELLHARVAGPAPSTRRPAAGRGSGSPGLSAVGHLPRPGVSRSGPGQGARVNSRVREASLASRRSWRLRGSISQSAQPPQPPYSRELTALS